MTKPRILLLFLLAVCVSVFQADIFRAVPSFAKKSAQVGFRANAERTRYAALPPSSYVVVDAYPYAPWVRLDFDHPWVAPKALTNQALTYVLDPALQSLILNEWEGEPLVNRALASLSPAGEFFSDDNFAVHSYALFADSRGEPGGALSIPFFAPPNNGGGLAGYQGAAVNLDTPAAIPEPSTAALFGGLGALLICLGRVRRTRPALQLK